MQLTLSRVRSTQRGFSLVELMVGITIGLIVTAGASVVAVNQINEHRRLMLETQVQQDLRAAADLLQQDMRRAGFRGIPQLGVWQPASGVGTPLEVPAQSASASPYAAVSVTNSVTDTGGLRTLEYKYARKNEGGTYSSGDAPLSNEYFGVRWDKGKHTLYLKLGKTNGQDNWQPITDPDTVQIINFEIQVVEQSFGLGEFCENSCVGSTCPQQSIRRVEFKIRGRAVHDSNVVRTLTGVERIRADTVTGACP